MVWRNIILHFTTSLVKTIRKIPSNHYQSKYKKMKNFKNDYGACSGNYRIIFFIHDCKVFITKFSQRRDVNKWVWVVLNSVKRN